MFQLYLCTDRLVCLSWIFSHTGKLDKISKKSVFVMNRLSAIQRLCDKHPIKCMHVPGIQNQWDAISRCVSHGWILKTFFFTGIVPDSDSSEQSSSYIIPVMVPNPSLHVPNDVSCSSTVDNVSHSGTVGKSVIGHQTLVDASRCYSFKKFCLVTE